MLTNIIKDQHSCRLQVRGGPLPSKHPRCREPGTVGQDPQRPSRAAAPPTHRPVHRRRLRRGRSHVLVSADGPRQVTDGPGSGPAAVGHCRQSVRVSLLYFRYYRKPKGKGSIVITNFAILKTF